MLEVTSKSAEAENGIDFADIVQMLDLTPASQFVLNFFSFLLSYLLVGKIKSWLSN